MLNLKFLEMVCQQYDFPAKGGKRTIEMFHRNLENENQFSFDFVKVLFAAR